MLIKCRSSASWHLKQTNKTRVTGGGGMTKQLSHDTVCPGPRTSEEEQWNQQQKVVMPRAGNRGAITLLQKATQTVTYQCSVHTKK